MIYSKFDGFNAYLIQTVEFNNKISEQEYDAFFILKNNTSLLL